MRPLSDTTGVPPEQLVSAIHVVAQGEALLSPSVTRRVIEEFTKRPPLQDGPPPELSELTAGEVEVLQPIARGLSNRGDRQGALRRRDDGQDARRPRADEVQLRDRVQAVVLAFDSGLIRPGANQPS